MAVIGIKHPVFVPITTYTVGARPTYGTGSVIGKAIKADISLESNDSTLYADDAACETDTSFKSGTIKLGVDDLSFDIQKEMLGNTSATVDTVDELRKTADDVAPEGGFGFYKSEKKNGSRRYEATFYLRTQFKEPNESAETKGESISWQTPEIEGKIKIVENYLTNIYCEKAKFTTEAAAIAWLDEKANIS